MELAANVSDDIKALIRQFEAELSEAQINSAFASALNRVNTQHRKKVTAKANELYSANVKKLSKREIIKRASPKNLQASSIVISNKLPISRFKYAQTATGVSTNIRRNGFFKGAFVATVGSAPADDTKPGHEGVFDRSGRFEAPTRGRYKGRVVSRGPNKGELLKREIIKEQYTLSTAGMFSSAHDTFEQSEWDKLIRDNFELTLTKKLENLNKKRAAKAAASTT
jgi:hypothetical protein